MSLMKVEKIKRIFTREGLVILGVLVASGILLWVHYLIPFDDSATSYIYFCSMGGRKYTVELKEETQTLTDEEGFEIFTALHRKYPRDFFPDTDGAYRIPRDFKINYAKAKFGLFNLIKNVAFNISLYLLFIAYPAYLIFRFISWSMRLLIEE